jgi:hypothetical protein
MKRCPQCGEVKPLSAFSQQKTRINSWCKECFAAYTRARRALDPEGNNRYQREWNAKNRGLRAQYRRRSLLKNTYGLTEAQFDELLARQNGRCPICLEHLELKNPPGMPKLAIDHDHVTGAIRGLLCGRCNAAIGLLREDIAVASRAVDYLEAAQGISLKVV